MRLELQRVITPKDRDTILFVDFIGNSVMEVLVDRTYITDVVEASSQYGCVCKTNANPFSSFATRCKSSNKFNTEYVNARYLHDRLSKILRRRIHPEARQFYAELQGKAEKIMDNMLAQGVSVSDAELYPWKQVQSNLQPGSTLGEQALDTAGANRPVHPTALSNGEQPSVREAATNQVPTVATAGSRVPALTLTTAATASATTPAAPPIQQPGSNAPCTSSAPLPRDAEEATADKLPQPLAADRRQDATMAATDAEARESDMEQ